MKSWFSDKYSWPSSILCSSCLFPLCVKFFSLAKYLPWMLSQSFEISWSASVLPRYEKKYITIYLFQCDYIVLEIKPCGLVSRIRDMEADLIYWWTFLTSIEAVRGQTPYSVRTLWHFNSMFGPSHSAKVCGCCMVFGL